MKAEESYQRNEPDEVKKIIVGKFTAKKVLKMSDSPVEVDVAEWEGKLVGKLIIPSGEPVTDPETQVSEDDIKAGVQKYRILKPNSIMTMDYRVERLNVYVEQDSMIVTKVTKG